jgi:transcriptional regulator of aromatic amino acid metabolism
VKYLLANPASEQLFNYQEDQVIGKTLIEVLLNYELKRCLKNASLPAGNSTHR